MISTVTTSTVTTVTTVALAGSIALIGILLLFGLLFQKEITTASSERRFNKFGKALNIGIIPLMIAFILILIYQVNDVLN